jgi:hypothetical protein
MMGNRLLSVIASPSVLEETVNVDRLSMCVRKKYFAVSDNIYCTEECEHAATIRQKMSVCPCMSENQIF